MISLLLALMLLGCASIRGSKRASVGSLSGALIGGAGGSLFSPNDESRELNAIVFGLAGALTGGITALLTEPQNESSEKIKPLAVTPEQKAYQIAGPEKLPDFVMRRLKPVVIEEYTEVDQLGEDGALHEPHKVYRIKHNAELIARPANSKDGSPGESK